MQISLKRDENGNLDKNTYARRLQNLMNLVYLQAEEDDGKYTIPKKLYNQIQTELDFNPPSKGKKKEKENEIKARYRKRRTYSFWKDALDRSNIQTEDSAREFLMGIFNEFDEKRFYSSMTHSRYALETLELAIEDTYGKSKLILEQYKLIPPLVIKANKKRANKLKKKAGKVKTKNISVNVNANDTPF